MNKTMESIPNHIPAQRIALSKIAPQDELQMRADKIDPEFLVTLVDVLENPLADLEPVVLFTSRKKNGEHGEYYIGDGNHRVAAYRYIGRLDIPAIVHVVDTAAGSAFNSAWHYALGANADQVSKPRTRKDVRRAILEALKRYQDDIRGRRVTQTQIAEWCKCAQQAVSRLWKEYFERPETSKPLPSNEKKPEFPNKQAEFEFLAYRMWQPINDTLLSLDNDILFADTSYPAASKLEVLQSMRDTIKRTDAKLRELESAFAKQVAEDGDDQSEGLRKLIR
jgi:hypothetical protein